MREKKEKERLTLDGLVGQQLVQERLVDGQLLLSQVLPQVVKKLEMTQVLQLA